VCSNMFGLGGVDVLRGIHARSEIKRRRL
jgi:hypothetical protein